ncbi:MAG: curli production assembly protein CsgG [Acidobacteriota bacterium]|nr:curli production assembly protein CsgG [Acidobacteriota bacterium]
MSRFLVCILILSGLSAAAQTQAKKRIAVLNFDYATVQSDVSAIFGTRQDVGKGIADLLVDKLVTDGQYSIIERKAIDKIMAEQNFSNSDRVDPNSAAKLGRILGVDAIVIGSITQFGRDDRSTTVGGTALGGLAGRYGLGGVGQRKAKAVVGISARLINTDTGEILAVASGKGESDRSGAMLNGAGGSFGGGGGGAFDMSSKNFGDTILGEAVNKAVSDVAARLERESGRLPAHLLTLSGLVADVSASGSDVTLVLNIGSRAGVKVGDRLAVKRSTRTINDPVTGKVIRRVEDQVGYVTITDVDEASSAGKFSGSMPAKVGDEVKNQ